MDIFTRLPRTIGYIENTIWPKGTLALHGDLGTEALCATIFNKQNKVNGMRGK